MCDDVVSDPLQSFLSRNQVILSGELPLQPRLLIFVEFRTVDDRRNVIPQIVVRQLEFRDAGLVIQRDSVAVVNRLLEVVNGDVVAKDFLRPLLPGDRRRPGEAAADFATTSLALDRRNETRRATRKGGRAIRKRLAAELRDSCTAEKAG